MSTYDATRFTVNAVYDSALLGSARLGSMRLGTVDATLAPLDVASVSVSGGYQAGSLGELTPDPVTASGSLSTYGRGTVDVDSSPLSSGSYVEIGYDGTVLFQGVVESTKTAVEASSDPRGEWIHKTDWTTLSSDAILLATTVRWAALPAEGALQRLTRWFTVDTSQIAQDHRSLLYEPHAAQNEGSATLLDLLRAFTERTMLPVRTGVPATHITVLDTTHSRDGAPLVATSGTEDAASWTHSTDLGSRPRYSTLTLTGPDFPQDYPNELPPTGDGSTPVPPDQLPDVPLAPVTDPWASVPGEDGEPAAITVEIAPDSIWTQQLYGPGYGSPDSFNLFWKWASYSDQELSSGTYANMDASYWSRSRSVAVFDIDRAITAAGGTSLRSATVRVWPLRNDTTAETAGAYGTGLGTDVAFSLYSGQAPTVRDSGGMLQATALGDGPAVESWQMSEFLSWLPAAVGGTYPDTPTVDLDLPTPIGSVLALTLSWDEAVSVPGSGDNQAAVGLYFRLFIDVNP